MTNPVGTFRVGRHQSRNIYFRTNEGDVPVGCTYAEVDGPRLTEILNSGGVLNMATVMAMELLRKLTDDEPCDYDHNGECLAHTYAYPEVRNCAHAQARAFLSAHEPREQEPDEVTAIISRRLIDECDTEIPANPAGTGVDNDPTIIVVVDECVQHFPQETVSSHGQD